MTGTCTNTQQDGPSNRVKQHNNQPSSKQAKGTIRKPFLGNTSKWIVVFGSWSWKKFEGVKWNGQCRRVGNIANAEDTYTTTSHRTRAWRAGIESACQALQAGVLSLLYLYTGGSFMALIEIWQFRHQKREYTLRNNQPTVQQSKCTVRKLYYAL